MDQSPLQSESRHVVRKHRGTIRESVRFNLGREGIQDEQVTRFILQLPEGGEVTCNLGGALIADDPPSKGDEVQVTGVLQGCTLEASHLYLSRSGRWFFPEQVILNGTVECFAQTARSQGEGVWTFSIVTSDGRRFPCEMGPSRRLRVPLHNGEKVRVLGRLRGNVLKAYSAYSQTRARWFRTFERGWLRLIGGFVFGFLQLSVVLGVVPALLIAALNRASAPLLALGVAVLAFASAILVLASARSKVDAAMVNGHTTDMVRRFSWCVAATVSLFLLFALVCMGIQANYPDQFGGTADGPGVLQSWLLYGVDNLTEIVFFDVPGIYQLHFTSVVALGHLSRAFVLAFRLTLDFLLIVTFLNFVRFYRTKID